MTDGIHRSARNVVTVRFFGSLHGLRKRRGLSLEARISVPEEGLRAHDLARQLELPLDQIEAVFCNHKTYALDHCLYPGDEVAFVPAGTPGPHRFTLGIYSAGKGEGRQGGV